jgi:hypothetical protein
VLVRFRREGAENASLQATALASGTVTGRVIGPFAPFPAPDLPARAAARVRRDDMAVLQTLAALEQLFGSLELGGVVAQVGPGVTSWAPR